MNADGQLPFSSFPFSVWAPSAWDGTTHIQSLWE